MSRDRESIMDILASIHLATQYVSGMDRAAFDGNAQSQDAVIRRIEVMGEAAKRVSDRVRQRFPDVPWKELAGMRDRVIHGYDIIDLEIVWDTVKRDLPTLAQQLETILKSDELDNAGG